MPGEPGLRPGTPAPEPPGTRLDSWKEIAYYLNRHVTTVRRWERLEALPVHRHLHSKLGSVYAYASELDEWIQSRHPEPSEPAAPGLAGRTAPAGRLQPPPELSAFPRTVLFCGRDEERKRLEEAWTLAAEHQRQLVIVSGEPGAGKTRLAFEFARSVTRHGTVLVGRCDREALVPFAPLAAILQWLVRSSAPGALRRLLADVHGSGELALLVPEITRRVHLAEEGVQTTAEGRRFRLFDACSELLVATSRNAPILLIVEDVHWADQGTLLFLRHLVRSTRGAAICVVLTGREHDADCTPGAEEILESLRREQSAVRVALGPLPDQDVRRLLHAGLGEEPPGWLASFALAHAGGNPLFVTEMLKHLDETGALTRLDHVPVTVSVADVGLPDSVRSLLGRRLGRLSDTTRAALTVAAVMGREFRLSVLEGLVDTSEDGLLDAMDEALSARIVADAASAPGTFSFTHPLIRETLYTGITAARRVRLHHRVAVALEQEEGSGRLGELAYHFGQAATFRDAGKALDYGERAGDQAAAGLALEDAARYYEMAIRAADLLPGGHESRDTRVQLLLKRARSFFAVGQWALARSAFEAALELLAPDDEARRAETLVRLAETAFWLMDVAALRRYAGEAEGLAGRIGRDDLWADALAWLASASVADGDVLGGIETDRRVLARVGGIRSFGLARVPLTLYWAGCAQEATGHALQAVEQARTADDPAFLLYALQHLGLSLSGAGRYRESLEAFDEAQAFGRRCGAFPLLARATSMSVAPLLSVGDLEGAEARAYEARELAHRVAFEPPLVSAAIDLLLIFARSGQPGRADALLEETRGAVRKASGWHAWKWNMRLGQAQAELALARGDCAAAAQAAGHVVEQARARHRPKYEALALATRARAGHRLGLRQAATDAQAAVHAGRRLGDPAVLLECLLALIDCDGNDDVLAEARGTAQAIRAALPEGPLRSVFSSSISGRME